MVVALVTVVAVVDVEVDVSDWVDVDVVLSRSRFSRSFCFSSISMLVVCSVVGVVDFGFSSVSTTSSL